MLALDESRNKVAAKCQCFTSIHVQGPMIHTSSVANAAVYPPNWAPWRHYFWLFLAIFSIRRGLEHFFLPLKHVLKQLFVRVGRFFWAGWCENLLATLHTWFFQPKDNKHLVAETQTLHKIFDAFQALIYEDPSLHCTDECWWSIPFSL